MAVNVAVGGFRETEFASGTGHADEEEASFFFEFSGVLLAEGAFVGEEVVFDADDEDGVEFETLGGVEGHEGDFSSGGIDGIEIGNEAAFLEEGGEGIVGGRGFVVMSGGGEEFLDVGEALHVVLGTALFPGGCVLGAVEDFAEETFDGAVVGVLDFLDHGAEAFEGGDGLFREVRNFSGLPDGFHEVEALLRGPADDFVLRLLADSLEDFFLLGAEALDRHAEDATEGGLIVGIEEEAEVGEEILDFGAFVEGESGGDLVGDAVMEEGDFESSGEGVDSIEDGELGPGAALFNSGENPSGDAIGFFSGIEGGEEFDRGSFGVGGEEGFVFAVDVVDDELIGAFEDGGSAAEVFLEADDAGAGEVLFEAEDVVDVGTAPAIDGLIGIAGDAEIARVDGEGVNDLVLGDVGVLVFIDEDVAMTAIELSTEDGVVAQEESDVHEEVVEIDGIGAEESLLVGAISLSDTTIEKGPHAFFDLLREHFRSEEFVLGEADA